MVKKLQESSEKGKIESSEPKKPKKKKKLVKKKNKKHKVCSLLNIFVICVEFPFSFATKKFVMLADQGGPWVCCDENLQKEEVKTLMEDKIVIHWIVGEKIKWPPWTVGRNVARGKEIVSCLHI